MITSFVLPSTLVFISILYERTCVHRQRIILTENLLSGKQIGRTTNNNCFVLEVYRERPNERTNSSRMFVIYMKISMLHFRTFRNNGDASGMIFLPTASVFSNVCKFSYVIFSSSFSHAIFARIENVAKKNETFVSGQFRLGNARVNNNSFIYSFNYTFTEKFLHYDTCMRNTRRMKVFPLR